VITKAEMDAALAAAWESGYWHGTSHKGPLNAAAVDTQNPYKDVAEIQPHLTPAKACKVRLKTEEGRGAPVKESATASEPTPIKE
jgi:hypothetical protein